MAEKTGAEIRYKVAKAAGGTKTLNLRQVTRLAAKGLATKTETYRKYFEDVTYPVLLKFADKGKILDVGCSGGYFLKNIPQSFEKFGTELDPYVHEIAKKSLNINEKNLYLGDVLDSQFDNSYFDVITMRGVIEHVHDPVETIKKVSKLMKPGAIFYICATPNGESFVAKLFKQNWNLFHPVEHLWHFSSKNLSLLTKSFNLKLIWSEYPYIGTPYENINEDIKLINQKIVSTELNQKNNDISPPFFENMMSLIFKKY